jgi:hypothetical protein
MEERCPRCGNPRDLPATVLCSGCYGGMLAARREARTAAKRRYEMPGPRREPEPEPRTPDESLVGEWR